MTAAAEASPWGRLTRGRRPRLRVAAAWNRATRSPPGRAGLRRPAADPDVVGRHGRHQSADARGTDDPVGAGLAVVAGVRLPGRRARRWRAGSCTGVAPDCRAEQHGPSGVRPRAGRPSTIWRRSHRTYRRERRHDRLSGPPVRRSPRPRRRRARARPDREPARVGRTSPPPAPRGPGPCGRPCRTGLARPGGRVPRRPPPMSWPGSASWEPAADPAADAWALPPADLLPVVEDHDLGRGAVRRLLAAPLPGPREARMILFLSNADTELLALGSIVHRLPGGFPPVRGGAPGSPRRAARPGRRRRRGRPPARGPRRLGGSRSTTCGPPAGPRGCR